MPRQKFPCNKGCGVLRKEPGTCGKCYHAEYVASQPPPRPMSRNTARFLALASVLAADNPPIPQGRRR